MSIYHYTNISGVNGILNSKELRFSKGSWDIFEEFQSRNMHSGCYNHIQHSELRNYKEYDLCHLRTLFYYYIRTQCYYISLSDGGYGEPALIQNFCRGDGGRFEFDKECIISHGTEIFSNSDYFYMYDNVNYNNNQETIGNVCDIDMLIIKDDNFQEFLSSDLPIDKKHHLINIGSYKNIFKQILFSKVNAFEYENEYRIVLIDINNKYANGNRPFIPFNEKDIYTITRYRVDPFEIDIDYYQTFLKKKQ
jgi:hypothetical protein